MLNPVEPPCNLAGTCDIFKAPDAASPQRTGVRIPYSKNPPLSLPSLPNPHHHHHFERKTDPDQTEVRKDTTMEEEDKGRNGLKTPRDPSRPLETASKTASDPNDDHKVCER